MGPCEETNVVLTGVSVKTIPTYGFTYTRFWIGELCYQYPILVGDLAGMDLLLGLDLLIAVGAIIDFSQMTVVLVPSQQVTFHDHPSPQAGYVKVRHAQTLVDRHTIKIL